MLLDDGLDTANTSAVGPGLVIAIVRGMIREILLRRIIVRRRIERGGSSVDARRAEVLDHDEQRVEPKQRERARHCTSKQNTRRQLINRPRIRQLK